MTNREWLNTLSDEDFAIWATQNNLWDYANNKPIQPYPTRDGVVSQYSSPRAGLLKWLGEQRPESE